MCKEKTDSLSGVVNKDYHTNPKYQERGLSKQRRSWSDAAERGVWSGPTLFATTTVSVILKKKSTRSKIDLLQILEF